MPLEIAYVLPCLLSTVTIFFASVPLIFGICMPIWASVPICEIIASIVYR
jgi:hypothetical protein